MGETKKKCLVFECNLPFLVKTTVLKFEQRCPAGTALFSDDQVFRGLASIRTDRPLSSSKKITPCQPLSCACHRLSTPGYHHELAIHHNNRSRENKKRAINFKTTKGKPLCRCRVIMTSSITSRFRHNDVIRKIKLSSSSSSSLSSSSCFYFFFFFHLWQ